MREENLDWAKMWAHTLLIPDCSSSSASGWNSGLQWLSCYDVYRNCLMDVLILCLCSYCGLFCLNSLCFLSLFCFVSSCVTLPPDQFVPVSFHTDVIVLFMIVPSSSPSLTWVLSWVTRSDAGHAISLSSFVYFFVGWCVCYNARFC